MTAEPDDIIRLAVTAYILISLIGGLCAMTIHLRRRSRPDPYQPHIDNLQQRNQHPKR